MKRRKAFLALGFLGSFLLGCAAGGSIVFVRTVPPMAGTLALFNLTHAGNEAYVRYRYGSYPVAKAALLQYADQIKSLPPTQQLIGPETARADLGLTYGRLAVAAARAGQPEESARYMKLAQESLSKSEHPVDEVQVRASVERVDSAWDQGLLAQADASILR